MTPIVGSFVSWKELYNDAPLTLQQICDLLQEFNLTDMVESVAKLNFYISNVIRNDINSQIKLLRHLLPKEIYEKAEEIAKQSNYDRTFFMKHQFLFLLRLLMSFHSQTGKKVEENVESFSRILFSVTSHIEWEMEKIAGGHMSRATSWAKILPKLIRNHWINHSVDYARRLIYAWQIYMKIAPTIDENKYNRFENLYMNAIGLTPVEFIKSGFLIVAHYERLLMSSDPRLISRDFRITPSYFDKILDEPNRIAQKAFKYMEHPISQEKKISKPYDVLDLYKHPIVRFSDDSIMAFDLDCLQWKVTDGVFWEVFDKVDKDEKWFMNSYWGDVCHKNIIEYLTEIVKFEKQGDSIVFIEEDKTSKHRQVDAIIYFKKKLFLFEITIRGLKINTLQKATPKIMMDDLDEMLLTPDPHREHSSGKLIQIDECLKAIRQGMYRNALPREAENAEVIPVLIVLGNFPVSRYMGQMIEKTIERKRGIELSSEVVEKTLYLSAEDVDIILWAVENNLKSLDDLLGSYLTHRFDDGLLIFAQEFLKLELGRSSFAKEVFNEFRREISMFFYGEPWNKT